jgi:gluconokinase
MNLPARTPFIIGGSDGTLANLGSLCLSSSEAAITIGTSAAVRITSTKPVEDVDRMIFNYRLDEKTFVCGGAVNNGGNVFKWLLESIFANHTEVKTYEQLFEVISQVAPGSDGLLFIPYLHGERAPIWDEKSCGVYMGLSAKHTLHHFARAAAEGVCFALQHVLSSLEEVCGAVLQITISGGLVQSANIMQLLADVTGKKLEVQQNDDASAIGAAYLAQKAIGMIDEYASIKKGEAVYFLPQQGVTAQYQRLIPMYKALYPLLKDQMHLLHQLHH